MEKDRRSAPRRGGDRRHGDTCAEPRPPSPAQRTWRSTTSPSSSWTARDTSSSSTRCAPPVPASSSSATATSRVRSATFLARLRGRRADGHRRHARGSHLRGRPQVHGRGHPRGKLWARDDTERAAAIAAGYDFDRVLTVDDLVQGNNCFFAATGITSGDLCGGVRYDHRGAINRVARYAFQVGHRADGRGASPACVSCAASPPSSSAERAVVPGARPGWTIRRWYERAVFYELLPRGFFDSNADGIGDFQGAREKLATCSGLGVD